jgi:hypothetical protein
MDRYELIGPDGKSVWLPLEEAKKLAAAGEFRLAKELPAQFGDETYSYDAVLSPEEFADVSSREVAFQPIQEAPILQERIDRARNREYGEGALANAAALSQGLARGVTGGLFDVALSGLYGRETIGNIREANPVFSAVGNVAGATIGALASGSSSLLGKVLAVSPASKIVQAEKLMAGAAPSLSRELLAGAASGAAYEMGQGISAAITDVKNPELTAESIFADMGMYGLFGAIGGGTGSLLGRALGGAEAEVVKKTTGKAAGRKAGQLAGEGVGEGGLNVANSSDDVDDGFMQAARKALNVPKQGRQELAEKLAPVLEAQRQVDDVVTRAASSSTQDTPVWEAIFGFRGRLEKDAAGMVSLASLEGRRDLVPEMRKLSKLRDVVTKAAAVTDPMGREIFRSAGGKAAFGKTAPEQVQKYVKSLADYSDAIDDFAGKYITGYDPRPPEVQAVFDKLITWARTPLPDAAEAAAKQAPWNSFVEANNAYRDLVGSDGSGLLKALTSKKAPVREKALQVYNTYLKELDNLPNIANGIGKKHVEDLPCARQQLLDAWEKVNGVTTGSARAAENTIREVAGVAPKGPVAKEADELLKAGGEKSWLGRIGEAVKSVKDKTSAMDLLLTLVNPHLGMAAIAGRHMGGIAKAVAPYAVAGAKAGGKALGKTLRGRAPVGATLAQIALDQSEKSTDPQKQFKAQSEALKQAIANPAETGKRSWANLKSLQAANFKMADLVQAQVERVLAYQYEHMPKDPGTVTGLFTSQWKPSKAELERWADHVEGSVNPVGVLERVATGSVSPPEVAAVKTLYPKTYEEYQKQFLAQLPEIQKHLSYKQQVKMSILMDIPVNSATDRKNVQFYQSLWDERKQPNPQVNVKQSMNSQMPTQAQRAIER